MKTQPSPKIRLVANLGLLFITLLVMANPVTGQEGTTCELVTLHYHRSNADYGGWGLHAWGPTSESVTWEAPLQPAGEDEYGLYWLVEMEPGATMLNYIVHNGDQKDPGPDQSLSFAENGCEIWLLQGRGTQYTDPTTPLEELAAAAKAAASGGVGEAVIVHYRRGNGDYDGWGLHVWGPTAEEGVTWSSPLMPAGEDDYGIYWVVDMQAGADLLNYIVHKGDEKDPGPDQSLDIAALGNEIWLIQGSADQYTDPGAAQDALTVAGVGDIVNKAQAYWLTADTIVWPVIWSERSTYTLHYDPQGAMAVSEEGIQGGGEIVLEYASHDLNSELAEQYPHLSDAIMLRVPEVDLSQVPEILKGQVALSVTAPNGDVLEVTSLQIAGALDDLYTYDGPLGVTWEGETPTLQLWAPTARSVTLHLFTDSDPATYQQHPPHDLGRRQRRLECGGRAGLEEPILPL